ncbi:hypothetical protein B0T14DRAFT_528461 [Immersiella caudata]|uniref:Uncharacterized protein n=1 Tax=Immersiella caudata TaxID=314043 RepID=A0AA40BUU1_9PEZI|nr:hypothetical protein B0T14DRAFT_528461 [Immersiella caudata]
MASGGLDVTLGGGNATGGSLSCTYAPANNIIQTARFSFSNAQIRCAAPKSPGLRKRLRSRLQRLPLIRNIIGRRLKEAERKTEELAQENKTLQGRFAECQDALARSQASQAASEQRALVAETLLAEKQQAVEDAKTRLAEEKELRQEWQEFNAAVEGRRFELFRKEANLDIDGANKRCERQECLVRDLQAAHEEFLRGHSSLRAPQSFASAPHSEPQTPEQGIEMHVSQPLSQPLFGSAAPDDSIDGAKALATTTESSPRSKNPSLDLSRNPNDRTNSFASTSCSSLGSSMLTSAPTRESAASPATPPPVSTEYFPRSSEDWWSSDEADAPTIHWKGAPHNVALGNTDADASFSSSPADVSIAKRLTRKVSQYFTSVWE